ncbi:S-adenosylmethionine-diacylgycerolhomoserine-N-methyltransferase [Yoonia maritima]|uniref:S-adenosylmethionine-diacylgycerolhomoserine-N-methyltransferase n=1 Tax=Yoonia maritima TaxID=1435347 RepID=A0A2T0W576_9RHOB|nr:class I SAM-dependent methyltransferase [Yoonia maritima]PRY80634.1 S-adenosylmethionine-diacylgycerolhomoserine-N-methyltransferase [Yoonia maritima]
MTDAHGALMDSVYRRQRWIYDLTRKYYLLGRDHALRTLRPSRDAHILEIACGTGRNLDKIDRRYPNCHLYGLDISSEMLLTARHKLGQRVQLAQGDASQFDAQDLFSQQKFDRIVMSYCISMIPAWQDAISEAIDNLSPRGELHIVDFGDQSRLPVWFKRWLRRWLSRFHVTPRDDLAEMLNALSEDVEVEHQSLLRGYAQYACIRRFTA